MMTKLDKLKNVFTSANFWIVIVMLTAYNIYAHPPGELLWRIPLMFLGFLTISVLSDFGFVIAPAIIYLIIGLNIGLLFSMWQFPDWTKNNLGEVSLTSCLTWIGIGVCLLAFYKLGKKFKKQAEAEMESILDEVREEKDGEEVVIRPVSESAKRAIYWVLGRTAAGIFAFSYVGWQLYKIITGGGPSNAERLVTALVIFLYFYISHHTKKACDYHRSTLKK